jgi:hypothetical protein
MALTIETRSLPALARCFPRSFTLATNFYPRGSRSRVFAAFFPWRAVALCEGCLASARRSVFLRRLARFLTLSLP